MVRVRFFLIAFAFLALFKTSLSFSDCSETLSKLDSVSAWTIQGGNLHLKAEDLFPADYLQEVEQKEGAWTIKVSHRPDRGFVQILGTVNSKVYVRVKLIQDPKNPHSLIVDDLNLQDPLKRGDSKSLSADQMGRGLSPQVFRHIKEQLFKIAKAGGFQEIRTDSQQHFAVVMLYKRLVGMEPANDTSKKVLDYLEGLYTFARKELPEDLRPENVEEFTRWLGSGGSDPSGLTDHRILLLQKFLNTGEIDPSFSILKNKKGEMVAALFNDHEKASGNIVFFEHSQGKPQILHWLGLAYSHQLELIKKL